MTEVITIAIQTIRDRVNEIEHHLLEKNWEMARTHVGSLREEMDTLIDNIDEGKYV